LQEGPEAEPGRRNVPEKEAEPGTGPLWHSDLLQDRFLTLTADKSYFFSLSQPLVTECRHVDIGENSRKKSLDKNGSVNYIERLNKEPM
jgi:hypothetical protein